MIRTLLIVSLAFAAFACGGEADVTLQLAPGAGQGLRDTAGLTRVTVTLARVEAHVAGADAEDGEETEGGWEELDFGEPCAEGEERDDCPVREIDLLSITAGAPATLGTAQLPEGKITQLRLFFDEAGVNEVEREDGTVCPVGVQGAGTQGVKINQVFKGLTLEAGGAYEVTLELDVPGALTEDGACAYEFRPVIKWAKGAARE